MEVSPFFVPEDVVTRIEPDIVFRLSRDGNALRSFPKYRSKAARLLRTVAGVHYIKAERCFFFPTEAIAAFLETLREENISFAVTETTGMRLKESAQLRLEILSGVKLGTAAELRHALLGPYLRLVENSERKIFALDVFTTDQLRACFPTTKAYQAKRRIARGFDTRILSDVMFNASLDGLKLWLTQEVKEQLDSIESHFLQEIENLNANFEDSLVGIACPRYCWIYQQNKQHGLLIEEATSNKLKQHSDCLKDASFSAYPLHPTHLLFNVADSRLLGFFEKTQRSIEEMFSEIAPVSENFQLHLDKLTKRKFLLDRQARFHQLQDEAIELQNRELERRLYPHQRVAAKWLSTTAVGFLGDDMGLGKTLSVLVSFEKLRALRKANFLLVVCPNSLVENWRREVNQWLPKLKLQAFPQNKRDRLSCLKNGHLPKSDGLIINYEALRLKYVFPELKKLLKNLDVMLCVDESQRIKNPNSKTFAALQELAPICSRRVLLSGTPTPKDISDIWAQMMILDQGMRFGRDYYKWLETVAELGTTWSRVAIKKFFPEAVRETTARVHEVLLRRKKEDVLNLPEKTFSVRDIPLTGEQLRRFEEIRKELLIRITSTDGSVFYKEITNILEEYLRAVQVASNPKLVDENWSGEPAKFLELDAIVDEVVSENNQKVVIWTNYLGNVSDLCARYENLGTSGFTGRLSREERQASLEEFQDKESKLRVLIAIPAAGGVGITLTAAQTAVYLDKTWNAEHWLQSIDRLHRIGQSGTVNIISLNSTKVDALISASLRKKERLQAELLGDESSIGDTFPSREELLVAVS